MYIDFDDSRKTAIVKLDGHFVFSSHSAFRGVCGSVLSNAELRCIQVEMSQVIYVDSAALGLLLLMRDRASAAGKTMQLKGARGTVKGVLEVAKFDQLFEMVA